jgi:glyoxylase-like metal-dependent hydrolase (beta-lactamase superfamily II)
MMHRGLVISLAALFLATACVAYVIHARSWLLYSLEDFEDIPMVRPDKPALAPGTDWFNDWYTIERIDDSTFAIGEPRYYEMNYNFLILGEDRAVLFDTGPGLRDIRPVVDALTDLPVVVIASHYHYDHVGGHGNFPVVALADLPVLRRLVTEDGMFTPTAELHLSAFTGSTPPMHRVAEWWAPGKQVDLGGRELIVLHTPGHSPDSISLFDRDADQFFSGDYIYVDYLYAFLPDSNMGDYLQTAHQMLSIIDRDTVLYPAHSVPSDDVHGVIELGHRDVVDLRDTLEGVKSGTLVGEGFFPRRYPINDRLSLFADFDWLQDWD